MKTYTLKYHAPYGFANFKCTAATIELARAIRRARDENEGFMIPDREIKSETFR